MTGGSTIRSFRKEGIDIRKIALFTLALLLALAHSSWAMEGPFDIKAATLIGFDDNPRLDSSRDEDGFAEETVSVSFKDRPSDYLTMRASYDLINVNYFDVTEEDVLLQEAGAGLDFWLMPTTAIQTDYNFTHLYMPDDELVTSFKHGGRAGLYHEASDTVTLWSGFTVTTKDYDDRKTREAEGTLSDAEERNDVRTITDSVIRVKVSKDLRLYLGFIYYRNDSDDQFHDYYDYEAYKVFTKAYLKLLPKLSAALKFSYETRDYDSRPLFDDPAVTEESDLYVATGGLYYKLLKNITLGFIYTYRQKNSNEPSQKYSSSVSTVGLYYSF